MGKNNREKSSRDGNKSSVTDSRFANVASDLRFKPLRVKDTVVIAADDDRFKNCQQSSANESLSDPRGRKFSIHKTATRTGNGKNLSNKLVSISKKNENPSKTGSNVTKIEHPSPEKGTKSRKRNSSKVPKEKNSNPSLGLVNPEDSSDDDNLYELTKDIDMEPGDSAEPKTAKEKRRLEQLLDPNLDFIRGVHQFSESSSSEDDSSSDEEEEEEYDWGTQDKDAQWDVDGHEVEETRRLAVCNIEWDRFQAPDILMVLKSFAPPGGHVTGVSVYLSEFGKERLKKENTEGPLEVKTLPLVKESNEENSEEKNYEALRKYHFNRLKYYYAVAECDSVTTSRGIYMALDGTCLESGGIVDLRYIPDDTTFDDPPVSSCGSVPSNYEPKSGESFSRSQYVRAKNSWDVDDDIRKKTLQQCAYVEDIKDDQILKDYIASDSEGDSEEDGDCPDTVYSCKFEAAPRRSKEEMKKRLGWLLNTKFDLVKEAEMLLLSRVLGDAAFTGQGIVKYDEHAADSAVARSNSQQLTAPREQRDFVEGENCSEESEVEEKEKEEELRQPSTPASNFSDRARSSITARKSASNEVHKEEAFDDDEEEEEEQDRDEYKNLLPFERYLLKRKKREKEHKKAKKLLAMGCKQPERDDCSDIPDELKNDPFFKEELKLRRKEKLRIEKEKREEEDRKMAQEQREKQQREAEMALLMHQDRDGGPQSVDMRQLVKHAKEEATTGGRTKKLSRWKLAKLNKKAKRLAKEGVYLPSPADEAASDKLTAVSQSTPLMAPSDVVNDERFANIFDNPRVNLDPSHPEYVKHKTPYLAEIAKEVQKRQLSKKRRLQ